MARLLLVGVGNMGRPYVAAARRLGVQVAAVESVERAATLAPDVDAITPCHGPRDEHWAAAAQTAIAEAVPDGVLAFSEPQVMAAALVADALGLAGPGLHAATLSRNKALQRGCFAARGLPQPEFELADDIASLDGPSGRRFPAVVKPLSGAGSAGVEMVGDAAEFAAVSARRSGEPLLVETAVQGPEFSWEGVVRDGSVVISNVTEKDTTGPPYFIEVAHRLPVAGETVGVANELAAGVIAAMRMRTGIAHLEFRISDDGPRIMEVAVRTPGDYLMDALGLAYGIDWFELLVRLALGMELPALPVLPVAQAASFLAMADAGRVCAIEGVDKARQHPHVVAADVWVRPGDVVPPTRSSAHRVGFALISAPTAATRDEALAFARQTLQVVTRPA